MLLVWKAEQGKSWNDRNDRRGRRGRRGSGPKDEGWRSGDWRGSGSRDGGWKRGDWRGQTVEHIWGLPRHLRKRREWRILILLEKGVENIVPRYLIFFLFPQNIIRSAANVSRVLPIYRSNTKSRCET